MTFVAVFPVFLSKIVAFLSNPKKETVQVMDKELKTNHLRENPRKTYEEN